jgi:uncharacterized protein (DUF433 family)
MTTENGSKQIYVVPGLRCGRPVIRGMRITADDVVGWPASGMSEADILDDFPELTEAGILAAVDLSAETEK